MKFKQILKRTEHKRRGRKLLSEKIVLLVQKLYARGLTMREAASRAGVALGSVHKIISGKHPNQTKNLDQVKKEESAVLYKKLRKNKKQRRIFNVLPPFREIDWMRIRGRILLVDSIIARRVDGVLGLTEVFARCKETKAA